MWQAGAPVRSGQHNAEVLLSLKDTSAQRRQQQPSAGTIQLIMHVAAAHVTLPISTVASKQLPVWEVMPQVTLLLPSQPGAAQTCA